MFSSVFSMKVFHFQGWLWMYLRWRFTRSKL